MPEDLTLESLVVENFRSIHGEVVVPLNAPVVLIHGPNGTGKSSLMTALALALAGPSITGIAEPKHLVHHDTPFAAITLGTSAGPTKLRIGPEDSGRHRRPRARGRHLLRRALLPRADQARRPPGALPGSGEGRRRVRPHPLRQGTAASRRARRAR